MQRKVAIIAALVAGLFLLSWAFDFFVSDAAVRFAQQIRDGVRAAHLATPPPRYKIELHMRAFPQGCDANYTVQFSKEANIVVWCKNEQGQTTSSSSTTYHGNWVHVPRQFVLDRVKGQPLVVELESGPDKDSIVDVH